MYIGSCFSFTFRFQFQFWFRSRYSISVWVSYSVSAFILYRFWFQLQLFGFSFSFDIDLVCFSVVGAYRLWCRVRDVGFGFVSGTHYITGTLHVNSTFRFPFLLRYQFLSYFRDFGHLTSFQPTNMTHTVRAVYYYASIWTQSPPPYTVRHLRGSYTLRPLLPLEVAKPENVLMNSTLSSIRKKVSLTRDSYYISRMQSCDPPCTSRRFTFGASNVYLIGQT